MLAEEHHHVIGRTHRFLDLLPGFGTCGDFCGIVNLATFQLESVAQTLGVRPVSLGIRKKNAWMSLSVHLHTSPSRYHNPFALRERGARLSAMQGPRSNRHHLALSCALLWAFTAQAEAPGSREIGFREVSAAWGLEFRHHHGGSGEFYMPETMGSGVVIFDYDGDGDDDVFFVDSGAFPGYEGETPRSRLFQNDGPGRFRDVTERSGIEVTGYGMGAVAGDVDGDSDLDLYVTAFGTDQLFRNRGDGTFEDTTEAAGLGNPLWGASAALADVDGDSDLDLYVVNYVDFTFENNPPCGLPEKNLRSYCHPDVYSGLPDRFYRNRGDGTFEDRTEEAGFSSARGNGLGAIFGDVDGDLDPDLYVANDMTPNYLFRNRGDGTFEDVALLAGAALSDRGEPEAGMGVAMGDLDGDRKPEIMVTHLDQQTNALYAAVLPELFEDRRYTSQLARASLFKVGFGVVFADFDLDGDLDVFVANGHIIHNIEAWGGPGAVTYRQPNQLFTNDGRGRFRELEGAGLTEVRSSRGAAVSDLDLDGDLDLVVSNSNDRSEVYENLGEGAGGWLAVDLGSRRGIGARLELIASGRRQVREVRTASSYLSQSSLSVYFGLGANGLGQAVSPRLEVCWPDGREQVFENLPPSKRLRISR